MPVEQSLFQIDAKIVEFDFAHSSDTAEEMAVWDM